MNKQAYINGFVKRAAEYGVAQPQAIEFLKQAFIGEPAYKEKPELTEDELGSMSYKELKNRLAPEKGEGVMAHLKRHPGAYLGATLGSLLGSAASDGVSHFGGDNPHLGFAGAAIGAGVGSVPDKLLDLIRKRRERSKALGELSQLRKHMESQKHLNSEASTVYSKHSLGF